MATLGRKVRQLRKRHKMKSEELASRIGKSQGFVSQIESDESGGSETTLRMLSEVFDVPVGLLADPSIPAKKLPELAGLFSLLPALSKEQLSVMTALASLLHDAAPALPTRQTSSSYLQRTQGLRETTKATSPPPTKMTGEHMHTIGDRVRAFRKARGLTQSEIAEHADCSKVHISQIERNLSRPGEEAQIGIAEALGVSKGILFDCAVPLDKVEFLSKVVIAFSKLPPEQSALIEKMFEGILAAEDAG